MKTGGSHSISRIRTFDGDAARAHGTKVPAVPKVQKKEVTAQDITNNLLKTSVPKAEDFLDDTSPAEVITPPKIKEKTKEKKKKSTPKKSASTPSKPKVSTKKNSLRTELKEEITSVHSTSTKVSSLGEKAVYDISNNDLDGGTLITNKRRKKHRLIPSMFAAMHSWFGTKKKELTTPKKPEHTINKAESRIATITAAARESKHAPQSDHGVVIKRLTKTKRKMQSPEVLIKKKEAIEAPQWASIDNEDTSVNTSSNAPEILTQEVPPDVPVQIHHELPILKKVVEEKEIKKSASKPKVSTEAPQWASIDNEDTSVNTSSNAPEILTQEVPPDVPVQIHHELPILKKVDEEKEILIKEQKQIPPIEQAPSPEESPKVEVSKPKPKKRKTEKVSHKKRPYKATPVTTSGIPVYVFVIVILGASLLGIGGTVYLFGSATTSEVATIVRIPTLFSADIQTPIELRGQTDIISTLTDTSFTTRETMLIYPTVADNSGIVQPADTQTIFRALNFKAPGSFTRGVTDISFGSYNGTDPFILMKVTNFDTAFGGLLSWEPDMSADLSPLFGPVVTKSYDPYARTATQHRSAFFRDTVVANKSVRVLVNENDTEKLMYAFINPNLILITTNSTAFNAILPLINK